LTIIVDTNVIIATLIRAGIVRGILTGHPGTFATPASCLEESWETRGDWNRQGVPEDVIREALDLLARRVVIVVPDSEFQGRLAEAAGLIPDPDDAPVVALALAIDNEGIWTFNTRDFAPPRLLARVRVLTTGDVKRLLEGS